ncbi:hypothetical protein [Halegenticoccus tardaugens]|uniref:hypothetical protein n=1 Tax=Halegenticoccus tardaugens TaxID=2071624 RepID=UPI001E4E856C|nr:hypothetical protein [Halegenticoccus tardaugens]
MSEHNDDEDGSDPLSPANGAIDDTPTVSCSTCGREWDVSYELDELGVGNQALEQFALDHKRHTGHYPDGIATWRAICLHCPEEIERLSERAVSRWAKTHARHTRHALEIRHATGDETTRVEADDT